MDKTPVKAINLAPPILITGCRRSGTTLLRAMLNQHPALLAHPAEPQFILDLYRRFGRYIYDVPQAVGYVRDHPHRAATITPEALHDVYGNSKQLWLQEFVQRYLSVFSGDERSRKRLVLKDPYFIRHLGLVFDLWPEATVIHVVRDPRANVSSQRARWPKASLWECIMWWREAARVGHNLAGRQPKRCIELRYEDLVRRPEQTLQQLCQFLHLPYTSELLEFELETISFAPGQEPEAVLFRQLDPARLSQWQKYLSPLAIRLIETACSEEMTWYRYKTSGPPLPRRVFTAHLGKERVYYQLLKAGRWGKNRLWQMGRFLSYHLRS
jgi:hypothetical protein